MADNVMVMDATTAHSPHDRMQHASPLAHSVPDEPYVDEQAGDPGQTS